MRQSSWDIYFQFGKDAEDRLHKMLHNGTVEVKSDKLARHTGNLFIEVSYRGQPSGISTTQADFWAFEYDSDTWLIIPTEKLKRFVNECSCAVRGGDHKEALGVLLPLARFVTKTGTKGE